MQVAIDYQASKGIGCIHTVSGVGFAGNLDMSLEKLFAKSLNNGFSDKGISSINEDHGCIEKKNSENRWLL